MIKIVLISMILLLAGCSQKINHSIQLENTEKRNISLGLINRYKTYVPKDKLLESQSWHYKQTTYRNRYLFENDEIAATFYLAHHATHIYMRGNEYNFRKYKKYFLENQVTAIIKFVPNTRQKRNKMIIDYFRINEIHNSIAVSVDSTGKNILKPSCEVVEIPNSFIKDFK